MASQAQIKANRANARKSTGPRTPAGKGRSSQNALKHGLTARSVVLPDEDPQQWQAHFSALLDDVNPKSGLEAQMAGRIALLLWRTQRAARIETEILQNAMRDLNALAAGQGGDIGSLGAAYALAQAPLERLSRHESALVRDLHRALHDLERLQARRRGEQPATPTAIDIDVVHSGESADEDDPDKNRA